MNLKQTPVVDFSKMKNQSPVLGFGCLLDCFVLFNVYLVSGFLDRIKFSEM